MSKQDEQMLYERQEEKIRSQSDAFIQFLTKRGLLGDSDIDDEEPGTKGEKTEFNAQHAGHRGDRRDAQIRALCKGYSHSYE